MGVWIEITRTARTVHNLHWSLPSWECGLKYVNFVMTVKKEWVAPFVGVWIEILVKQKTLLDLCVAPFVGVWIEIFAGFVKTCVDFVAPFVGVWIEMRN